MLLVGFLSWNVWIFQKSKKYRSIHFSTFFMRLITHNLLCCEKCQHYPLNIKAEAVELLAEEFNLAYITRLMARVDYNFLMSALKDIVTSFVDEKAYQEVVSANSADADEDEDQPLTFSEVKDKISALHAAMPQTQEAFMSVVDTGSDMDKSIVLRATHTALSSVALRKGSLHCSKCATVYLVTDFIPNMMRE